MCVCVYIYAYVCYILNFFLQGNLRYWLQEPDASDQYSVMYDGGAKTAIYVNTNPEPSLLQEREVIIILIFNIDVIQYFYNQCF